MEEDDFLDDVLAGEKREFESLSFGIGDKSFSFSSKMSKLGSLIGFEGDGVEKAAIVSLIQMSSASSFSKISLVNGMIGGIGSVFVVSFEVAHKNRKRMMSFKTEGKSLSLMDS